MADEIIKAPQETGKRIDHDLKAILDVLEAAPDHEGEVLYIRHGNIALADGDALFDILPLTGGT